MKMRLAICAILMITVSIGFAGSNTDMWDMSLDDLLNAKIVTASKSAQSINEAGAIIEVVTADQIEKSNADNLYDVLGTVPGIEIVESIFGYTNVIFRGITQTNYNSKSCLLVNGQPIFDQLFGTYYLETIPLSSIERVEIIRGPGGVLYGTDAYAGVINIITKKAQSEKEFSVDVKGGSFNTRDFRMNGGSKIGDFNLYFGSTYHKTDGYIKKVKWDEDDTVAWAGDAGVKPYGTREMGSYPGNRNGFGEDFNNYFMSIGYKKTVMNAIYYEANKDKYGLYASLISTGLKKMNGYAINLKHSYDISDKFSTSGIVWYEQDARSDRFYGFPPTTHAPVHYSYYDMGLSTKTGIQFDGSYAVKPNWSILGGVGYESGHCDPVKGYYADSVSQSQLNVEVVSARAIPEAKSVANYWLFGQTSYKYADKYNFNAGARFNNDKETGSIVIPSASFVYIPKSNLTFKLIYGSGFRNPAIFEKFARSMNAIAGNKDLKPETINTLDLGVDYLFSNYSIRVNGFYSTTDNLIGRRSITAADTAKLNAEPGYGTGAMKWTKGTIYDNFPGTKYKGVEVSFQGKPLQKLYTRANLCYKSGEDNDGNELKYFAPITAFASGDYEILDWWQAGVSVQYIGERKSHYGAESAWQQWVKAVDGGADYTISAYTLLNLSLSFKLNQSLRIVLDGKNLGDTEYDYPENVRHQIPVIPGGPGRSLFVTLKYQG